MFDSNGIANLSTGQLNCTTLSLANIEVTSSGLELDDLYTGRLISTAGSYELNASGIYGDILSTTNGMFSANRAGTISLGTTGLNAAVNVNGALSIVGTLELDSANAATIKGVTNEEFLVGVGSLGVSGEGVPVMLDYNTPTVPNNLRIYDMVPVPGIPNQMSPFYTTIKWGFESLTSAVYGDAANNQIYTSLAGLDLTGDEILLSGALTNRYYTSSNTSFGQYLIESVAVSGLYAVLTLDSSWTADKIGDGHIMIVEDANYMEFEVTEWAPNVSDPDGEDILLSVSNKKVGSDSNVTSLQTWPYHKYKVRARSQKASANSSWALMPAGTYDPDHVGGGQAEVSYGTPFEALLPNLTNTDATLTVASTDYGFVADAGSSWKGSDDPEQNCHQYHFAYTTSVSGLNFDDISSTHSHVYQTSPYLNVSTSESNTYTVGVRPMQNGMPVGDGITSTVTSGAGGMPPTAQVIAERDFDIIAAEGDVTTVSGVVSDIAFTHEEHDPIYNFFKDQVISDGTYNYLVNKDNPDLDGDATGATRDITTSDSADGGTGLVALDEVTIGQSKRARRIIRKALTKDVMITSVSVSVNSLHSDSDYSIDLAANPVVIRVYQEGNENAADSITISSEFTDTVQTMNVRIISSVGASRVLIVDAYDPNDNNNVTSISGSISVHGEAITVPGDVPSN